MPTVVRDTIYPTFSKEPRIKYNFMVCVSSLAIGTFALNSWSNALLHKFLNKTSENSRRNIKSTLFRPLFSITCILKLSSLLK